MIKKKSGMCLEVARERKRMLGPGNESKSGFHGKPGFFFIGHQMRFRNQVLAW